MKILNFSIVLHHGQQSSVGQYIMSDFQDTLVWMNCETCI